MKPLLQKSISYLRTHIFNCQQRGLRVSHQDFMKNMSMGIELTKLTMQRDFLKSLLDSGEITAEIRELAERVTRRKNNNGTEERRILGVRVLNAVAERNSAQRRWTRDSVKLSKKLDTVMAQEYRVIVMGQHEHTWKTGTKKTRKKKAWIRNKSGKGLVSEYRGVPLSDEALEDKFGSWREEGVVLGGIATSIAMRAYLRLPNRFKILEELVLEENDLQAEVTASKQRHSQAKEAGVQYRDNKERLEVAEREWEERAIQQGDCVSFGRMRTTDLRFNKRIGKIPALGERQEIQVEAQKMAVKERLERFIQDNVFQSNLTEEEMKGREEIEAGVEAHGWVHGATDKSGKQCLDTAENYLKAQMKTVEEDVEVPMVEIQEAEKIMYQHTTAFCKALGVDKDVGSDGSNQDRMIESFKVVEGGAPKVKNLRKDHKVGWDPVVGPKTRILLDGKKGANAGLAALTTKAIRPLRKEAVEEFGTEVCSTEELLHSLEQANLKLEERQPTQESRYPKRMGHQANIQGNKYVIGSLDVANLYGNCRSKGIGQAIRHLCRNTRLKYDLNTTFILKYLSLSLRGGKTNTSLDDFIPRAKGTTTLKSYLENDNGAQFYEPIKGAHLLTSRDTRDLLGWLLTVGIEVILDNHFFSIGNRIYRQKDGAPTGVDVSVEAADIYMLVWESKFLEKLEKLRITTQEYKRYVDDILALLKVINVGWAYDRTQDKMVYNHNRTSDLPDDQRTFLILTEIGNTIDSNIQLEYDVPSLHTKGKLPILDLEVWLEGNRIRHGFYRKDIATKYVIHARTALGNSTKRNSLFQEGLRRVRNSDPWTGGVELNRLMGEYMNDMRMSGHSHSVRQDILKGVLERREQIEAEIARGDRIRYRNRETIGQQKQAKLGKYAGTWYIRGEYTSVFKVQASMGGKLAKEMQTLLKGHRGGDGGYTKVIEMGGAPVIIGGGASMNVPFRKNAGLKRGKTVQKLGLCMN